MNAAPAIVVNSPAICAGQSATLTATGVSTYSWSNGATTSSIVITPATNTTYVVNGTLTGCSVPATSNSSITVNALPSVSVNSGTICEGQVFTITPSGASTYTITGGSATVSPASTNSYSITGTSAAGCVSSNTAVSTVSVFSNPTISVASTTICSGSTATLTASGANTYTWSTASNATSITVSPSVSTGYSVNGTSTAGCIGTSQSATVTVTSAPSVAVNSSTICAGQSATLSASGASTYSWNTGATTSTIVVSPATNTVYTVTGTLTGCAVFPNNTGTVTVKPLPTITVNSGTICEGQSFTLLATGASTYAFSSGSVVTPANTTSYSVIGTGTNGCASNSVATTITVNPNPTLTASNGTICAGQVFTILPSGAGTYTYSSVSATVSPASTSNYSVTGTSTAGCAGTNTAVVTVSVFANPTISVSNGTICSGQVFTLNPSGANTYSYSSVNNTVNPTTTTSYSISGTSTAGCVSTSSAVATVSVFTTPTVSVNSGTICNGQSFTLTGSGASTYTYSGGNVVSPAITTTYAVIGSSTANCVSTNTAIATVTVFALPSVSVSPQTICSGATATLVASGANTYSWSTSATTSSIAVSPVTTSTYNVIGTSTDGCTGSAVTTTVTITSAPTVAVNSATICAGQTATLTASGVTTYTWSNSLGTNSIVTVSPLSTTVYTVNGNLIGCSVLASNTATVLVNPLPTVSINGPTAICIGQTASLTVSGANTYSWSTSETTSNVSVSPTSTGAYSVTGTFTSTGCSNTATVNLIVNPLPTVSVSGILSVCNGNAAILNASGASTYSWSTGSGSSSISVSPSLATSYTVTGTDMNNCVNTAVANVSVGALPTISISQGSICSGQSFTLIPSGGVSYTYSSGSATISPTVTSVYTVTGSSAGGCTASATASVTVYSNPTISAGSDLTLNMYDTFTINATASGASSYSWQPATALDNATVMAPSGTAMHNVSFTVTATSSVGCQSTSTVNVIVNDGELIFANYMSPNGDGANDTWKVNNPNLIKDYEVTIIDQWGNEVFHKTKSYENEWDGKNGGEKVPDGAYYYIIKDSGGKVKHKGSITLLR